MKRILITAAGLLLTAGCQSAGPGTGWASEVFPDTVDVRRVETPLLSGVHPSPDGSALVGYAGSGLLAVAGLDGRVRHLETGPGNSPADSPRFSRDGRWVAYNWYDEAWANLDLRILPVDGGAPRVVLHRPGYPLPLDWSPDGTLLAALEFGEDNTIRILLVPTTGGEPILVRALDWRAPNAVSFSPDGRFLAFDVPTSDASLERDLAVYDLQTGRERRILDHPANDLLLGWSPTGHLYFRSERTGLPAAWRVRMAEGRPSGDPELVKPDFLRTTPVGFTGTGDFFYTVRTGGPAAYSVALDPEGRPDGPARALTPPGDISVPNHIAVSRDGRLLSYVASDNVGARRDNELGGALLKVVAIDGSQTREFHLPPRIRNAALHRWIPDGTGLIFRGNEEGRYGVFRLDFASGRVDRLLSGGGLDGAAGRFRFDVTPDGESLVYIEDAVEPGSAGGARLVVHDLDGSVAHTLVSGPRSGPNVPPAVSPDGQQVAFYSLDSSMSPNSNAAFDGVGSFDLMLVPVGGGAPRRIATTSGGSLAWTPDGTAILVSGPDIVRIPAAGGAPVSLGFRGTVVGVDPRSRTMVFSLRALQERWDLWLMKVGGAQ